MKPKLAVESWPEGMIEIVDVSGPAAVPTLSMAHDRQYVEDVIGAKRNNGHYNCDAKVTSACRWNVQSMVDAAAGVMGMPSGQRVACSPSSGFHHAHHAEGGAFCTFNGLIVAAISHIRQYERKVLIIDCDWHWGDGTAQIIDCLKLCNWIDHVSHCGGMPVSSSIDDDDDDFEDDWPLDKEVLAWVQNTAHIIDGSKYGLILYQAGADMYVHDPLGGCLSIPQLKKRDEIIFEAAQSQDVPLVWNFAGGYKKDKNGKISEVLDIHRNTLDICHEIYFHLDD